MAYKVASKGEVHGQCCWGVLLSKGLGSVELNKVYSMISVKSDDFETICGDHHKWTGYLWSRSSECHGNVVYYIEPIHNCLWQNLIICIKHACY
jgi:hypothetical protein